MGHALEIQQIVFDFGRGSGRLVDVRALGQPDIDHELRAGRVGKEALVDELKAPHRSAEDSEHHQDGQPAKSDAGVQEGPVYPVEDPTIRIPRRRLIRAFGRLLRSLEKHHPQQRRDGHRRHPAEAERDQHHLEQGLAELARRVIRQADRPEGHDRDRGGAQQRQSRLTHHVLRRLRGILALLNAHQHPIHHHDGIVDQHAERDDQRAERNSLQGDLPGPHEDEGAADGQHQNEADQQAAAQPHEDQQHHDHDGDRLDQALEKTIDGDGDGLRLQ